MARIRALNPVEQALLVGALYYLLFYSGAAQRVGFLGYILLVPVSAAALVFGNGIAATFAIPIGTAFAGLAWFAMCFAIADLRLRPLGFATMLLIMSGLSAASDKLHSADVNRRNAERAKYERSLLAAPNVDYDTFIRRGVRPGMSGVDFMYSLITNRDLAAPSIPHLKKFIEENGKSEPNWTNSRHVAAQVIFELTGERVPYRGVENDRRLYEDPYDRNNQMPGNR